MQREQRAGQRERQREHRVAEADEGGVGSQTVQGESGRSTVQGRQCAATRRPSGCDAAHQIFFHIVRCQRRQRTAISSARLPGSIVPSSCRSRAPRRRRASRSRRIRAAGHRARAGARPPARRTGSGPRRSPGCRCRSRRGRPTRRTRSIGGVAGAGPRLLRGQVTTVAPRRGQPRQLRVRQLHAVHREQPVVHQPEPIEVLDRPARRRLPAPGSTHPTASSSARHGPVPSRGTRPPRPTRRDGCDTDGSASRAASARNSAGDTEYGACGTSAARSRRDARRASTPTRARACAITAPARRRGSRAARGTRPRTARCRDSGSIRHERVGDVADQRRARCARFGDRCRDRRVTARRRATIGAARSAPTPTPASTSPGGTCPRIHDSSRCVCALTRPGRIATSRNDPPAAAGGRVPCGRRRAADRGRRATATQPSGWAASRSAEPRRAMTARSFSAGHATSATASTIAGLAARLQSRA